MKVQIFHSHLVQTLSPVWKVMWQMDGQTVPNPNTVEKKSDLASICWAKMSEHSKQYAPTNGHVVSDMGN